MEAAMSDVDVADANKPGKRYTCPTCGTQVMCTKGGDGRIECHGAPMERNDAKPLPSSD
jgi:hypothetical protein